MRELPAKVWHYVAALASVLVFVPLSGLPLWPPTWLRVATLAVLITTATHMTWEHYLWRLRWVQRLTGRPDVRGTWRGTLKSRYHRNVAADPEAPCSVGTAEIPVYLVVRQTASTIRIRFFAARSAGAGEISTHYGDGTRSEAIVVYRNQPHQAGELIPHMGTSHYVFQRDGRRIEATHWTERFTRGTAEYTQRVPLLADSYAQAKSLFD